MSVSRRTFLAGGIAAAGVALDAPVWAGSTPSIPDSRALRKMLQPRLAALGKAARVERLGSSSAGRPIDLISIGRGSRSVLIVGVPHANEPIGTLTVMRLIDRLAADRRFREQTDTTWHFIPAIDVDGLEMNQGWFAGPPTLDLYFRHFYRPAFALQPEYSFPLDVPGYRFTASTPENLCWQRALEIARPVLQSSLHGCDSGGAFYLLSRNDPGLARQLARQPRSLGLSLNELGEGDPDFQSLAPGVFSFYDIAPLLKRAAAAGKPTSEIWSAGASSAEYAAERYNSFSVTCEIPIWEDARERSAAKSGLTMAALLRHNLIQSRENLKQLEDAAPLLERTHGSLADRGLVMALREAATNLRRQIRSSDAQLRSADDRKRISNKDLARLQSDLVLMRPMAMLARLAELRKDARLHLATRRLLARRIAAFKAKTRLRAIPTDRLTDLQMRSITTTLDTIARR